MSRHALRLAFVSAASGLSSGHTGLVALRARSSSFNGLRVRAAPLPWRHSARLATSFRPSMVAAAAAPQLTDRKIGDRVSGFKLERAEFVQEVGSMMRLWVHERTGTELMSVSNGDENKTFGVVFRTPPSDSTGVPHILEHSVLCGSRKYPVKEPFVELIKSSLNTFLNAFTYPDKTCYPVASCNERDFYNLVDVYMDAVFHPTLTPDTLAQEGHHLELEKVGDPITIKGVVYNEMKGAYSDSDRVLAELSQRVLFPETTYGVESGGHPRSIPDLTWPQFKSFYDRFYHPSNARMWFYGDDSEEKRLAKSNEVLSEFDRLEVDSKVGLQAQWSEPKGFEFTYDAGSGDDLSKKVMATVNWVINPPVDQINPKDLLALSVLNHILLAMSASPLRKALTDSGIGDDVVGGGLETDLRQMTFSVGLKGMKDESVPKMEQIVFDVLRDVEKNGLPPAMIESSLNSIEFRLRENNTGSFPKGLSLMLRSMTTWLHDADPLLPLRFEDALGELKARLAADEPVFQQTVSTYLLNNNHRALVKLRPDPNFSKIEDEVEKKRIDNSVKALSDSELQDLVSETQRLKAQQAAPDDPSMLAKIPMLCRDDLDKKVKTVSFDKYDEDGAVVLHHPLFTNGVVYVDICFDMNRLPTDLLPLMSIFSGSLTELGTTKRDFVSLQQEIGRNTGGIRSSTFTSQIHSADGNGPVVSKLTVRGKGMLNQVPALLDLMREVVMDVDINNKERLRQILLEERSGLESGMAGSGHQVASGRLGSMFRRSLVADELMGGVSYLNAVRALISRLDDNWDSVVEDLKKIQEFIVSREGMLVNVTTTGDDFKVVRPALNSFLSKLPAGPTVSGSGWATSAGLMTRTNEGLIVPSAVNYVGKAGNVCDFGFVPTGGHSLAAKHLGTSYLWDTVRVQGGAYGGFCRLDSRTGMFAFLSYRDPNVKATLDAYDGAASYLNKVSVTEDTLTKDVIGMIGSMDSYQLPDAKGFASAIRVLTGDTDDLRQERRDQVMSATVKDFRELGEMLDVVRKEGTVVVVGGEDALKKANDEGLSLKLESIL
jgi:presequence protease